MKFMVTWCVHEDKRHEALRIFAGMSDEEAAQEFGDLKVIGRWHDLVGFTGVAIVQTDDPRALKAWLLRWNGMVDVESVPVLDDAETRQLGRQALG